MLIRRESPIDYSAVEDLQRRAFGDEGQTIGEVIAKLRTSLNTEPGLSLVAIDGHRVVGHVMFTRNVLDAPSRLVDVQVLSPLGVLPSRQRQGLGSALIRAGLDELMSRGVPLVFLEGPPDFYSKLGFRAAGDMGFRKPSLRIPDAAFQVMPLPAYQSWMTGTLVYRQAFWDHDAVGLREPT